MSVRKAKVVVIGSAYIDMAIRCDDFPLPGQTAEGTGFSYSITGSGPNQAIQAALCGCQVAVVGKVGKDAFGDMIKQNLAQFDVNTNFIYTAQAKNTGVSLTTVNNAGENTCCVSVGANKALVADDIAAETVEQLIGDADICLINGELPKEAVSAAIRSASLNNTKVILDPALGSESVQRQEYDFPMDYYSANILIPDFAEAAELAQRQTNNIHAAKLLGMDILARGVAEVVVKLGRRGAVVIDRSGAEDIKPFEVSFVDHDGCSDAFAGALAASCAVGDDIRTAVRFASAAGALACSKFGAQESLPRKDEIIELLQKQSD
ncbi:MAG: hypothetical protein GWO86_03240 [Planctomycetes bacterium]|nr:hypothetical protein [Planctomycetota bacterium]